MCEEVVYDISVAKGEGREEMSVGVYIYDDDTMILRCTVVIPNQ